MTYIEFADAVEKMMNKKMKGGVRASLYTAMKNNGKERRGCREIDSSKKGQI